MLTSTKEAKFKTEVRQIQEYLETKKAQIIIKQESNMPVVIPGTLAELGIDTRLEQKYGEKLIIDQNEVKLRYTDKVTNQEAIWLQQLGIEASLGPVTFFTKVSNISNATQKIEGYADFDTIITAVKQEKNNAIFAYDLPEFNMLSNSNGVNYTEEVINKKIAIKEMIEILEKSGLSDDTFIKTGTGNPTINEILDIATESGIVELIKNKMVDSAKKTLIMNLDMIYGLYISSDEGDVVIDMYGNVSNANKYVFMYETEAEAMFVMEENDDDLVAEEICFSINGYKGTDKDVKIPDAIFDENGKLTKHISRINSLESAIKPFYTVFGLSLEEYNNLTVAQLWGVVAGTDYEGADGTSTDNKTKYETLVPLLSGIGLTENDVLLKGDYIPYVCFNGHTPCPMPEGADVVDIETIEIPRTVLEIGTKAFLNQASLAEIKYAPPNSAPTIASDAFEGCTSLTKIIFTEGKWPLYKKLTGEDAYINGYETYWGAPNENVKIYDEYGEVEI